MSAIPPEGPAGDSFQWGSSSQTKNEKEKTCQHSYTGYVGGKGEEGKEGSNGEKSRTIAENPKEPGSGKNH